MAQSVDDIKNYATRAHYSPWYISCCHNFDLINIDGFEIIYINYKAIPR